MKDKIFKEKFFEAQINDVWQAISKAEEITAWFLKADFKAEVGYDYTFTHEEVKEDGECSSTIVKGTVMKVEPVNLLTYTWVVDGATITTVNWYLEEKDGGTLLKLEHTGISNYPSEAMATNMFNSFSGGWDNCIAGLTAYIKSRVNV